MSRDLEEQLNWMGPEYRAVVARLRAAAEAGEDVRRETGDARRGWVAWGLKAKVLRPALVAASLLVLAGLAIHCLQQAGASREAAGANGAAHAAREYLLAALGDEASMREMIATQNPDGSWANDFLTRRNAASLKRWGERFPAAQVAYKKAVRNLRARGVL